jgi:hypothetical protein
VSDGRPSPAPISSTRAPAQRETGDDLRERDAAGPELRPVREELFLVERLLVDQRVRLRRAQESKHPTGELDLLVDQLHASSGARVQLEA